MKKRLLQASSILLAAGALMLSSCKKDNEDNKDDNSNTSTQKEFAITKVIIGTETIDFDESTKYTYEINDIASGDQEEILIYFNDIISDITAENVFVSPTNINNPTTKSLTVDGQVSVLRITTPLMPGTKHDISFDKQDIKGSNTTSVPYLNVTINTTEADLTPITISGVTVNGADVLDPDPVLKLEKDNIVITFNEALTYDIDDLVNLRKSGSILLENLITSESTDLTEANSTSFEITGNNTELKISCGDQRTRFFDHSYEYKLTIKAGTIIGNSVLEDAAEYIFSTSKTITPDQLSLKANSPISSTSEATIEMPSSLLLDNASVDDKSKFSITLQNTPVEDADFEITLNSFGNGGLEIELLNGQEWDPISNFIYIQTGTLFNGVSLEGNFDSGSFKPAS